MPYDAAPAEEISNLRNRAILYRRLAADLFDRRSAVEAENYAKELENEAEELERRTVRSESVRNESIENSLGLLPSHA